MQFKVHYDVHFNLFLTNVNIITLTDCLDPVQALKASPYVVLPIHATTPRAWSMQPILCTAEPLQHDTP